jgi:hypothetical protein
MQFSGRKKQKGALIQANGVDLLLCIMYITTMKARIITDTPDDEFVQALKKSLTKEGIQTLRSRKHAPTRTNDKNEQTLLIVDMRHAPRAETLRDLHELYPHSRIVGFADQDGLEERTAMTFGGGYNFFETTFGAQVIIQSILALNEQQKPTITGEVFSAGNVIINTKARYMMRLPSNFNSVADAMRNMHLLGKRIHNEAQLTYKQCLILEALKNARDEGGGIILRRDISTIIHGEPTQKKSASKALERLEQKLANLFGPLASSEATSLYTAPDRKALKIPLSYEKINTQSPA